MFKNLKITNQKTSKEKFYERQKDLPIFGDWKLPM